MASAVVRDMVDFDVIEAIKKRVSTRTYKAVPLESTTLDTIREILNDDHPSPFGGDARFTMVEMEGLGWLERRKVGTYGFIKGAPHFIVGIVSPSSNANLHLGYVMERVILRLTAMDLGTCWLGGTFKRDGFAERAGTSQDERIPAITPVGIPARNKRLAEKIMRGIVHADDRDDWKDLFFLDKPNQPLDREEAGEYAIPLDMVRLAPSAKNGQPWRVIKAKDRDLFHLHANMENLRGWTKLDLGIATCHFDLARQYLRLDGKWMLDPAPVPRINGWSHVISWMGT